MAENSLFAILLRSAWWISVLVAAGIVLVSRIALPDKYFVFGAVAAVPFVVIACIALWRQLQKPSAARVATTLESVVAMNWKDFSAAMESAFRRDGYEVSRIDAAGADFEMRKEGRKTLVNCKRWKVGRTGVEPLRDLLIARDRREADEVVYVATGQVTEQAVRYAAEKRIRLMQGEDLALLLRKPVFQKRFGRQGSPS
jgi:restriction system protein